VPPIPAADILHWQKIFLQHTIVGTNPALKPWHESGALPEGVKRVVFLTKDNALLVQATSAGLNKIQEIIKVTDTAPRQVEVRLALTSVPKTNFNAFGVNFVLVPDSEVQGAPTNALQYLDGNIAAELLQAFTKQGRAVASPTVTTSNNVAASMNLTGSQPTPMRPTLDSLTVTPCINSDDTITVQLHMTISFAGIGKQRQQIDTLRTIRSGGTLALCVSPPKPAGGNDHSLLLFITPTIVGTQSSTTVTLH
jgi:type II secretory pathway component GspD/PulD (secretin)